MNLNAEADRLQGAALSPRPTGEGIWLLALLFLVGVQAASPSLPQRLPVGRLRSFL